MSRVDAMLSSDRGFCQLTCFQAGRSFDESHRAFLRMPQQLQGLTGHPQLGGFWLVSHWIEPARSGTPLSRDQLRTGEHEEYEHSLEYSWLFVQPVDLSDNDWLIAMRLLAEAHGQDAFILRANSDQVARLHRADVRAGRSLTLPVEIFSASKMLTFLRSRGSAWRHRDLGAFAFDVIDLGSNGDPGSFFAVLPTRDQPIAVGPSAITLYAAVPHNISARMFFSYLKVRTGG